MAKIEEAKAILSVGSACEAIDKALDILSALHHQWLVLDEMKSSPLISEHRRATVIGYSDAAVA